MIKRIPTSFSVVRLGSAKRLTNSPDGGEVKEINPLQSFDPA